MTLPTHTVAAGGVVFNEKKQILLVLNPRKGWEFPGGMVEQGETVPQGLLREIREESGVEARPVNVVGIYQNLEKRPGYNGVAEVPTAVVFDFLCRYVSGELATSAESTEAGWFDREEALRRINPRQRLRLQKALAYRGGFTCIGFSLDKDLQMKVREEYTF